MTTIEDFTSQYGLVQKIDAFGYMKYLAENPDAPRKHGKVVLVTADTPLKASRGEGKTTTTIALIDALNKRGIDATAVLRQPSMGITAARFQGRCLRRQQGFPDPPRAHRLGSVRRNGRHRGGPEPARLLRREGHR